MALNLTFSSSSPLTNKGQGLRWHPVRQYTQGAQGLAGRDG
jgi:hypothetical protein